MSSVCACAVCGSRENALRCSRCKLVYYCSKLHQRQDWRRHKPACGRPDSCTSTESAIRSAATALPVSGADQVVHPRRTTVGDFPEISFRAGDAGRQDAALDEMCRNVVGDMDEYGVCVLDGFLGVDEGKAVLAEVLAMRTQGAFKHGQLVTSTGREDDLRTIRGDQIAWIDGREPGCQSVGRLIGRVDALVMRANKMGDNGKLGQYNINGRTKVTPKIVA